MTFKFEIPDIIDIDGVEGSPYPRDVDIGSEEDRQKKVKITDGLPITEFEGTTNPYIDYESIDLLLSLQHPRSEGYDEMCFIVMGQAKELLFKSVYFELYNARLRIMDDDLPNASVILERAKETLSLLKHFWNVLSTIRPEGFKKFRDYLNVASGQQSFMYRHIEFILGNKNEAMALVHKNVSHVYPAIKKNLESPSLYDEVIKLFKRREVIKPFNNLLIKVEITYIDPFIQNRFFFKRKDSSFVINIQKSKLAPKRPYGYRRFFLMGMMIFYNLININI